MILVTGANGFLGRCILSSLNDEGASVRATGLRPCNDKFTGDYRNADITNIEDIKNLFLDITTVIHAAGLAHIFGAKANYYEKFRIVNEIGTVNVASAASVMNVKHFILISSVSVYGPYTDGIFDEDTQCNPVGPYARSKYNAELRAIEIAKKSGMSLSILRLATLYGEGDPGNVGRLIRTIDQGRFLWIGDGSNRKSLLYKGDAARACVFLAKQPSPGINIYNVSAPSCTMREIVTLIYDALEKHPFPIRIPALFALNVSRYLKNIPNGKIANLHKTVEKWLAEDIYDTHRFEDAYGYKTKTTLQEGLKKEVDWYQNYE